MACGEPTPPIIMAVLILFVFLLPILLLIRGTFWTMVDYIERQRIARKMRRELAEFEARFAAENAAIDEQLDPSVRQKSKMDKCKAIYELTGNDHQVFMRQAMRIAGLTKAIALTYYSNIRTDRAFKKH